MKFTPSVHIISFAILLYTLIGCREATISNVPYQRILINNFSTPFRTTLLPLEDFPNTLKLRVDGSINQQVILAVDQLSNGANRQVVRRDTLAAGTYTNRYFSGDYYSKDNLELTITAAPGTTGALTIEWGRY